MKKRISLSIVLVLVLSSFIAPLSTGAASKYREQLRDSYVHASAFEFDECRESGIWVGAFHTEGKQHSPPGRPQTIQYSSVWVSIVDYNWCTGEYHQDIFGYAELPASSLVVDGQLGWATLNAAVLAYDYTADEEVTLDIAMQWEAVGPLMTGRWTSHFRGPDFSYHARWQGSSRDAIASGRISDNGVNYAPDQFDWASIGKSRGGWMEISR
jgi:hypothetical protein